MDLSRIAVDVMDALGGPGLALVIAAEALFPPVPGELLLPFAGVRAAAQGHSPLRPVLWTTSGSVLGGLGVYAAGRALGAERTRALVRRVPLLEERDVDAAIRFFERFGLPAVALARFVPMVRTVISIPAGIERMPLGLFALATGIGSGVWNAAFILAGFAFGMAGGEVLEGFVRLYSTLIAVVGIIAATVFLGARWRSRRRLRRPTLER